MMIPTWGMAAKMEGIRGEGRKWQKAPVPIIGSFADCVAKWLELPGYKQRDCWLVWGYVWDEPHGRMDAHAIASYVLENGLPPHVVASLGGQPSREERQYIVAMPRFEKEAALKIYLEARNRAY